MFRRILFPTDFSAHARRTLECIGDLPGVLEVVILHVIDTSKTTSRMMRGEQQSEAREKIESERQVLERLGVSQVTTEISVADVIADAIEETAKKYNSTIIVMSARGKGLIPGLHLGSVTHRVVHDSSKNLLVIRHPVIERLTGDVYEKYCPRIFSKVIIPVDLSPEAFGAVRSIASIPETGEVVMVYVISRGETEGEVEKSRERGAKILEAESLKLKSTGADIMWRILEGDPISCINEYADEKKASLICSIPTDKGIITEMIHGSFTCELTRLSHTPVLIIRRG